MQISLEEAQELIDRFFLANPKVLEWIEMTKEKTWNRGFARSIYGRKRRFPFVKDRAHREKIGRMGVNMEIQSSVSDLCLLAYIRVVKRIKEEDIPVYVGPHIHDGFWLEVPDWYRDRAAEITKFEMEENLGFETNVYFKADIEYGKSWGCLHAIG